MCTITVSFGQTFQNLSEHSKLEGIAQKFELQGVLLKVPSKFEYYFNWECPLLSDRGDVSCVRVVFGAYWAIHLTPESFRLRFGLCLPLLVT